MPTKVMWFISVCCFTFIKHRCNPKVPLVCGVFLFNNPQNKHELRLCGLGLHLQKITNKERKRVGVKNNK